ncbi:MAG: FG-GAP-like repeat-containing protein [Bacteroidota bacterium]
MQLNYKLFSFSVTALLFTIASLGSFSASALNIKPKTPGINSAAAVNAYSFSFGAAGFTSVVNGNSAFGDFDNDGDLDVFTTGQSLTGTITSSLYTNNGSGSFTLSPLSLVITPVCSSYATWGDYDRDGDLDIAFAGRTGTGTYATKIFKNTGTAFVDAGATLTGVYFPSLAWADYDNDGDLDLFVAGISNSGQTAAVTMIYKNTNGSFTDAGAGLATFFYAQAAFGDYDNDGDLDLAVQGKTAGTGTETKATIYKNTAGVFSDVAPTFTGAARGSLSWGDYDADGDIDLLQTGSTDGGTVNATSNIYTNNGSGGFTRNASVLDNYCYSAAVWGDYDNDGDLDIAIGGLNTSSTPAVRNGKTYSNQGGVFTESATGFGSASWSSIAFGDIDNDGDLDAMVNHSTGGGTTQYTTGITGIYSNSGGLVANTKPGAPTSVTATETSAGRVKFTWAKASDNQTPQNGLSYVLRIGTTKTGMQALSSMNNVTNGYRRIAAFGPLQYSANGDTVKLAAGKYYFSLSAIDGALAGGTPSATDSITVTGSAAADSIRNITFKVDLGAEPVTGSVWVTGSFNSWALTATMTRGADNVYSVTLPVLQTRGNQILYKFVYNGWARQESVTGSCRSASGPRFFSFPRRDTTLGLVCYNKCTACDSVKVTFNVNMGGATVSPNGVHIAGDFQLWNPATTALTNAGGSVYTFSKYFSKGEYIQYKFLNGNAWGTDESVFGPCSFTPQAAPNRWLLVSRNNDTTISVAFTSCSEQVPQQGRRIAFVGSSGCYGQGSSRPSYMSFPAQFNQLTGPNSGLVEANFGRPGAGMQRSIIGAGISSYWASADLPHALNFRPDILMINLGGNDVKSTTFNTNTYAADYKSMLDSFRTYSPNVEIYMGPGFRSIVSTEQLCIDSLMPKQLELSAKWGLPYFDLWHPSFNPRFYFTADSLHPDSIGYRVLAEYMYEYWNTPRPVITQTTDSLVAPAGYAAYWWYHNGNLISPLAGTSAKSIALGAPGKYKVLVRLDPVSFQRLLSAESEVLTGFGRGFKTPSKIYPNPSQGRLNIEFAANTATEAVFEVYDAKGQLVFSRNFKTQTGSNYAELDLSNLKPGIYSVTGCGHGLLIQSRFVKQ